MRHQASYKSYTYLTTSEDESDYIFKNLFRMSPPKGYSLWSAAMYITSFMAGMGVLAMPHALAGTGWFGLILITLACINAWYNSVILGRMWLILEERWEEYKGKFRYPYPAIGQRAVGPWMRYVVTGLLDACLIGISVVYILLAAEILHNLTQSVLTLEYKYWIIILSIILCPLSWFGSIEEFWFAGMGALATAVLACISLIVAVILKIPNQESPTYGNANFSSASLAFGTILFSFGGIFMVPTFQNDMADRKQFNKAATIGFSGIFLLYLPVTIAGYAVLGYPTPINILYSIEDGYFKMFIEGCLAIHVFLAFLLAINPVAQEIEEAFSVKSDFNYKRCIIRSLIVGVILLVAYGVPHFDKIMNLIGGSTITLLAFVFPPFFYFRLVDNTPQPGVSERKIPLTERIFLIQIIIIGIAGGISCTYFAVLDIIHILS